MVLPTRRNRLNQQPSTRQERPFFTYGCVRRVFLKHHKLLFTSIFFVVFSIYRIQTIPQNSIILFEDGKSTTSPTNNKVIALKDEKGNILQGTVSKKQTGSLRLSDFLPGSNENNSTHTHTTLAEATNGREQILSILKDAGIRMDEQDIPQILQLPTWQQVTNLYGDKPVIIGLEQCEAFQKKVPLDKRFMGVAGNFNSGTTAFGVSLQANCRFPGRENNNNNQDDPYANDKVSHKNGMLSQVPWAKHKMAFYRENHTILDSVETQNVLPIILTRDPYFWMQSMCKQGYGVRWDHDPAKHCPNLVPNDYDWRRFGNKWARRQHHQNVTSIKVWMGANPQDGPSWDSLAHYWNAWYEAYYLELNYSISNWPRLIIRFEDTLFHPKQVMEQVCRCGGGELTEPFQYLLSEAKWNHKQAQNNLITAMVKYGNGLGRYRNMTAEDLAFARQTLNPELLKAFHYQQH